MLDPLIQDKRWWNREDVLLLFLLGVLFLLPGLHRIPLFDRDEPRFAVAARTMMETGDYIVPHFNGALRPDKPPLVYWLMDLAYLATGGPSEFGARLPSAICGTLTLIVIYFMVGCRFGRYTGFIAAMMLGSTALFLVESRLATADATMLLFISLSMACAWQAWDAGAPATTARLPRADYLLDRSGDRTPLMLDHLPPSGPRRMPLSLALLFWFALAAGTLTKGVPLVFVFVPMIALSITTGALPEQLRQWRSHFHLTGRRVGLALFIAALATAFLIAAATASLLHDWRLPAAILAALLIAMLLTPGLPGVFVRCFWSRGNWAWWKQLRPLIGVPLLIALVGWWVVWAGIATHWQLIADMVGNHFLNRAAGPLLHALHITIPDTTTGGTEDPMKSYGQPPGFFLVTVWGTFWPWSILIIPAAYHTLRRVRGKTPIAIDPRPYQFLLAWIIPMWILLELARGKLFHYPLPLFIPMAILCADTLVQSWHRLTDVLSVPWFSAMRWVTLSIWLALGVATLVAAHMYLEREFFWRCLPFAMALAATGAVSLLTWETKWWPYALALTWGGSLLMANSLILPDLPQLQLSRLAGRLMADMKRANPNLQMGVCNYEEATLVFYAGQNVRRFNSLKEITDHIPFVPNPDPTAPQYVLVVDDHIRDELDRRNLPYTVAFIMSGFNTANFKPVTIAVITNAPPPSRATRPEPTTQH